MTRDQLIFNNACYYGINVQDPFCEKAFEAPEGLIEAGELAGTIYTALAAAKHDPLVFEMLMIDLSMALPLGMLTRPAWETLDDAYVLLPAFEQAVRESAGDPDPAAQFRFKYCRDALKVLTQMMEEAEL